MQTIVITGASSGIGAELARIYGRRGDRVALLARRLPELEKVAEEVRALGGEAMPLRCDVTGRGEVAAAIEQLLARWSRIDVAIANAGVARPVSAEKFVLADALHVMETNYAGMLQLFAAVIPTMLSAGGGRFAAIASLAGLRGMPRFAAYSASKAAMQTFLEAVRAELAPHGIAVTTVNPGFIATDMTAKNRFRMPMLMPPAAAAAIIAHGIDQRRRRVEFPRPVALAMRTVRLLPDALVDRILKR